MSGGTDPLHDERPVAVRVVFVRRGRQRARGRSPRATRATRAARVLRHGAQARPVAKLGTDASETQTYRDGRGNKMAG